MPRDPEILHRLTEYIVSQVATTPPDEMPDADFPIIEKGLVDSLGLFKLIAFIEDEFHVRIEPEEILFENFATIGLTTDLVQSKLARHAGS